MRGTLEHATYRKIDAVVAEITSEFDTEELAELIKRIDEDKCDYELTEDLCNYFVEELKPLDADLEDDLDEELQLPGSFTIDGR